MSAHCLLVAKAPVPGLAKTRLGERTDMDAAADIAAAALLDTLAVAAEAFPARHRFVALTGSVAEAARSREIDTALSGWTVFEQVGDSFAERLTRAHAEVARRAAGPVVQIGMDTPQVTGGQLLEAAHGLEDHDAVLGLAEDGGWWVLCLRDPADAAVLATVAASTPATGADTRRALETRGLSVTTTLTLRDVDEVADAEAVAEVAPHTRFAAAWSAAAERVGR